METFLLACNFSDTLFSHNLGKIYMAITGSIMLIDNRGDFKSVFVHCTSRGITTSLPLLLENILSDS